ncbi:hypothetical protein DLI04_23515 [Vibrio parahaemolyticus]|nr:hypothetical protein [Vibrio parahaemolyticus]
MNVMQQCDQIIAEINDSKADCQGKLELIKTKVKELAENMASIKQPSRWDDLNDLRCDVQKEMFKLRERALSSDVLDQMKVLEARQDITMWITKGEASTRMIEVDIYNKDSVRLKAWLSINQENLNTSQRFKRQPVEQALINSLFEDEQTKLEEQLSKIEGAMKTNTNASNRIEHFKSSIKSSGLA